MAAPLSTSLLGAPLPYTPPAAGQDLSQGFGENHAGWAGAGKGALTGMQYGKYFGAGVVPAAAVGAAIGALKSRTNNTKNDREAFAKSLGLPNSTALWQTLSQKLPPEQAQELQNRATTRIGKHDKTANAQWMQDVQAALSAPPPVTAQTASRNGSTGQAMTPERQALIASLRSGTPNKDALMALLQGR